MPGGFRDVSGDSKVSQETFSGLRGFHGVPGELRGASLVGLRRFHCVSRGFKEVHAETLPKNI